MSSSPGVRLMEPELSLPETGLPLALDTPHLRAYAELLSRSGRTLESQIHGSSMGETIPDGSRIRIQWRDGDSYRAGQIVACLDHGFLFAHRIVHVHGDAIITQGDAWILCDPPLHLSQVVGEVISCQVRGAWRSPSAEPVRSPSDGRAARIQVRIAAICLAINLGFARVVTRGIIRLSILRKHCRQRLAFFRRRG